jgi:fatty acid/phospholipid biosynthesis enzyme
MRIGIDMMGGDFAPGSTIRGYILARQSLPADVEIVLIGDQNILLRYKEDNSLNINGISIKHAADQVDMEDHPLVIFTPNWYTDGYVGNMVLKEAEAFYRVVSEKGVCKGYFEMFNFENFGGTPVLGIRAPLFIGHGISTEKAIKSMLHHTAEVVEAGLVNRIKEELDK